MNAFGGSLLLNEPSEECRRVLQRKLFFPAPPSDGYTFGFEPLNIIMHACLPGLDSDDLSPREVVEANKARKAATIAAILATRESERINDLNVESRGLTALTYAVYARDVGTVKVLLDAGARPNARDVRGLTPLHAATVSWWDEGVASALLDCGADINAMSTLTGSTPLGGAILRRLVDVVKFLLRRGANPNAENGLPHSSIEILRQRADCMEPADMPIYQAFKEAGVPLVSSKKVSQIFFITSLMNHEKDEDSTAERDFFGETIFVRARTALKKGAELTITYSSDVAHWGIKK